MRSGNLYLNNERVVKHIVPPTTMQLFPKKKDKKSLTNIKFVSSHTHGEKDSQFIALAVVVHNFNEICKAYVGARKLYPLADHIAVSHKIPSGYGYQDDDEHTSGWNMENVLREVNASNVAVFMFRVYGEERLGKRTF